MIFCIIMYNQSIILTVVNIKQHSIWRGCYAAPNPFLLNEIYKLTLNMTMHETQHKQLLLVISIRSIKYTPPRTTYPWHTIPPCMVIILFRPISPIWSLGRAIILQNKPIKHIGPCPSYSDAPAARSCYLLYCYYNGWYSHQLPWKYGMAKTAQD